MPLTSVWPSGVRFCKERYLSWKTSLRDIFQQGFGEVSQPVFLKIALWYEDFTETLSRQKPLWQRYLWAREVFKDIFRAYRNAPEQCVRVWDANDLIGLVSVSGRGWWWWWWWWGGSHRLALCQGPRSCRARNRETQSPNYTIPNLTGFVLTSIYAKVFEKRWRSQKCHVTSHQGQSIKHRRGTHGPPAPQIWCNSDCYLQSYGILKKMAHVIFLWLAAILKVSVEPYRFSNIP